MEKKDLVIGIDMDDTLENLLDAWVAWLNKKFNCNVDSTKITEWELWKSFSDVPRDELYKVLYEPEFWKTVQPKPDAQKYLKKLYDEGYTIYIVTCAHYKALQAKVENCLLKYFPYLDWRQIISIRHKQMLKLDILVDDYHENLINAPYKGLLVDRPYNQVFNVKGTTIQRVYNWEQIYKEISSYYQYKSGVQNLFNMMDNIVIKGDFDEV